MRFYSDVVKNKCNLYREWKAHIKRSRQTTPLAQSFPWASSSRCWSSWLNPSHHMAFLHCVLSNVSSNCLLQKSIFTIEASLDFFSLFSNEISNWSPQWKYFFICCINLAFLHYVLSNVIKCLLKLPSTIKAYPQSKHFLDYLHWMFSNEISNWSPLWKYICIFCIYLAFSTLYYQMSPQIVF